MDTTGSMDTAIRFQRPVRATGFKSAGQTTWETVAPDAWAEVQDVLPSRGERTSEAVNIGNRPARIRFWHRTDITSDMRIVIGDLNFEDGDPMPEGNRVMQIIAGPASIENRRRTEVMAEEYSTAGGA